MALHRVLFGDVNDLVTEHAGELGFALDQRQRAARDVHVAARRRKCVHAVGVEHDEGPRQIRPRAALRERGADQRHVTMHAGILDHAKAQADPVADVGAELLLFLIGHLQFADVVRLLGNRNALADAANLSMLRRAAGRPRLTPRQKHAKTTTHVSCWFDLKNRDRFALALHDDVAEGMDIILPLEPRPRELADDDPRRVVLVERL